MDVGITAILNGPIFFGNKHTMPQSIYHAFDLPYTENTGKEATFDGDCTDPLRNRLESIKARGYTHIQISPPQLCKPSTKGRDIWYLPYQPYICVLDDAYEQELSEAVGMSTGGLCSQYGVTLTNSTNIGYRVGNGRYGSLRNLKDLIDAANEHGLKIIADVVLHHACHDQKKDGVLRPITYDPATVSFGLSDAQFPPEFFRLPGKGRFDKSTWGPVLNTGDGQVQEMIVGYLKLLSNLGIKGFRFDALKHIPPSDFQEILIRLKETIPHEFPFMCGYGEVLDGCHDVLNPYIPMCPLADFVLTTALKKCFVSGRSMQTLVMPKAMGNVHAVTCVVTHDDYPGVPPEEENVSIFYKHNGRDDPTNIIRSQLAISYLLAKSGNSPLILRFEDDRDIADLIKRGLHFRTSMEKENAPHEYMIALTDDVLLIGRQYGFAIINKGRDSFQVTDNIQIDPQLAVYTPNGQYKDIFGREYSIPGLNLIVHSRNAAFLVLDNTVNQTTTNTTFRRSTTTECGEMIFVVGNHPLLGNWSPRPDGFNGLLNTKSNGESGVSSFSLWESLPMRFPKNLCLEYKFVTVREGQITAWMPKGENLSFTVGNETHLVLNS